MYVQIGSSVNNMYGSRARRQATLARKDQPLLIGCKGTKKIYIRKFFLFSTFFMQYGEFIAQNRSIQHNESSPVIRLGILKCLVSLTAN